jgi:pimeloyl-ACP methyl ester carboxylesterase
MAEPSKNTRQTFRYSDEVLISYEVEGDGATPVVFLHGFAAALTTWNDIRSLFPPERFRLYLLDLKGFGFSSKPHDGRYAPEDQAAIVLAFLKALQLRHAVLVGHSLGGGIALLAFLRLQTDEERELIGRLVLIDCAAYPQPPPRIMRWLTVRPLGWCILHLLPLRFMVRYTLEQIMHNRLAITQERITRYMTCFGGKGIARVFITTCRQLVPEKYAATVALFRTITLPTLIIWGREYRLINVSHGIRLHGDIAGSRLVIIDSCGHVPQEERPAETFAALAEFLEETSGQ